MRRFGDKRRRGVSGGASGRRRNGHGLQEKEAGHAALTKLCAVEGDEREAASKIFEKRAVLAKGDEGAPAEFFKEGESQTREREKHLRERSRKVLFTVIFVKGGVHGSVGLHFDEIFEGVILGIRGHRADEFLKFEAVGFEFFEARETIDEFDAERVPKVAVHQERQAKVKKLSHSEMDAKVALVGIPHDLVEASGVACNAALKSGNGGVEIGGEFADVFAGEIAGNDGADLANLHGRKRHANAVKRIHGIAGVADDVPAIGRVAPGAFPHIRIIKIGVNDVAAADEFGDDRVLASHAFEKLFDGVRFPVGINIFAISYADAHERRAVRRAHGDAPNPVPFAEEMMGGEVRHEGAIFLFDGVDASQNFGIEIGKAKPKDVFLLGDALVEVEVLAKQAAASCGINEPARGHIGFAAGGIAKRDGVGFGGTGAACEIYGRDGGIEHLHAVLKVAAADFAVESEAIDLKGEQRRNSGSFVHHVGAVGRIINLGLEIVGEAVLWEMIFDEIRAEADFEKEVYGDFDEGFADNGAVFARAFDHGDFELGELHPEISGCELAGGASAHDEHISNQRSLRQVLHRIMDHFKQRNAGIAKMGASG